MARIQGKSDERAARWQELEPLRQLVTAAPIRGPGDSAAVISIDQSGPRWLSPLNPVGPIGPGGPLDLLRLLITEAIWWLVFRRSYTVHVRTNDHPPDQDSRPAAQRDSRLPRHRPAGQPVPGRRTRRAAKLAGRNFRQHPHRL